MKRTALIGTGLVILLVASISLFPRYFVIENRPAKSDIIILFAGSDSRLPEALQLLQEGYAGYLFIPVTFSIYKAGPNRGGITPIRFSDIQPGINLPVPQPAQETTEVYFRKNRAAYGLPWFYEATHVEMLLTKRSMDACGFKKAIFVSSPYHLLRMKIMADRVFNASYDIKLVPSRFEERNHAFPASLRSSMHVLTEFPKMIWFLIYDKGAAACRSIDKYADVPEHNDNQASGLGAERAVLYHSRSQSFLDLSCTCRFVLGVI